MQFFKNNSFIIRTLFIFWFIVLFFYSDFILFTLTFLMIFSFLALRAYRIQVRKSIKVSLILSYFFVLLIQMTFSLIILFSTSHMPTYPSRIVGILFIFIPFLIERYILNNNMKVFYLPSLEELRTVSFTLYKSTTNRVSDLRSGLSDVTDSFSLGNMKELILDLPRHSSLRYINKGSLTDEYFTECEKSLSDSKVYLVISNTGSAASDLIAFFTKKQFNHSSISFDRELKTIISYNGGEKVYPPGMNAEMIEFFNKKEDSSVIVYSLEVTDEQKRNMIEKVKEINETGSAYNLIGLMTKHSVKPNIMFCSQFVYHLLEDSGLAYFKKDSGDIRPTDFVELDYYRNLKFEYEIYFN